MDLQKWTMRISLHNAMKVFQIQLLLILVVVITEIEKTQSRCLFVLTALFLNLELSLIYLFPKT